MMTSNFLTCQTRNEKFNSLEMNLSLLLSLLSRVWLCSPMDCGLPGSPVLHYLLEFVCSTFLSSQWCHPTISSSSAPFSFCPQSFPASGSFPVSQLITLGGQSIGASASVLPVNIQDWFPLGSTGLILLMIHPLLWLHYYESYYESYSRVRIRIVFSDCMLYDLYHLTLSIPRQNHIIFFSWFLRFPSTALQKWRERRDQMRIGKIHQFSAYQSTMRCVPEMRDWTCLPGTHKLMGRKGWRC